MVDLKKSTVISILNRIKEVKGYKEAASLEKLICHHLEERFCNDNGEIVYWRSYFIYRTDGNYICFRLANHYCYEEKIYYEKKILYSGDALNF